MPLQPVADLPRTLYAEVAEVTADGQGRALAHLVLLRPGDGLTDDAVLEIAHTFVMRDARLADRTGLPVGDLVQSALAPPGGMTWHGLHVPEGTWVAAVRVHDDPDLQHVLKSSRRLVLRPVVEASGAKRGDDEVDRRMLEQVLRTALRPVVETVGDVEVRLKRLEEAVRSDPFGDAVRGRGEAGTREVQRLKSLLRRIDPAGQAITERRSPVVPAHPTLAALRQEADDVPLDPADPFADAVTRRRPPRRRPLGISAPPKREQR